MSKRKAEAMAKYLISKGINEKRLTTKAYGESQPLNNCIKCNPKEDQENRRLEFKTLTL